MDTNIKRHIQDGVLDDMTQAVGKADRFITLGVASTGRLLFISHTDRGVVTRIISAREATKKERGGYEKTNR